MKPGTFLTGGDEELFLAFLSRRESGRPRDRSGDADGGWRFSRPPSCFCDLSRLERKLVCLLRYSCASVVKMHSTVFIETNICKCRRDTMNCCVNRARRGVDGDSPRCIAGCVSAADIHGQDGPLRGRTDTSARTRGLAFGMFLPVFTLRPLILLGFVLGLAEGLAFPALSPGVPGSYSPGGSPGSMLGSLV